MLIVDTDPGTDDAAAIMMLLASDKKVDAFVSVYGNVAVDTTTKNLQRVLDVSGNTTAARYRGSATPLFGEGLPATHIHGGDGMRGAFASATDETPVLAPVDYIDMIRRADSPVTIIALGPLTNIARALAGAPDIAGRIERIILMGGAVLTWGNTTPAASFNLYNDPVAAAIVYDSGVPLVQVGMDVCRQANIRAEKLMPLKGSASPVGQFLWRLLDNHFMVSKTGGLKPDSAIRFNDALCIAYLLRPELFTSRHLPVRVEPEGLYTRGATIADFDGRSSQAANTDVLLTVDLDGYSDLVTGLLASYY